ncbi:MAG: hypothetical protein HY974_01705 [Candidatus Kerfeldbacteria bacterium]|nr:hypothetical protein [Candidatus Kerfeldbacteria bacterium]
MDPQTPLMKKERKELKRQEKVATWEAVTNKRRRKKIISWILGGTGTVVAVGALLWFIATRPNLPPTNMQGHIEESPNTHITDAPIPDAIQRHMLEHADGKGEPGIIIQYNCKKYSCEPDLIPKLTNLAQLYPDNVYLAPGDYDGKIILTKINKMQILENFAEQAIKSFVE